MVLGCIGGSRRRFARGCIGAGLALAAMLAALPGAGAQDYPSRPVKIIVPFPAGGTADVMPRVIGEWLSRKWGQPVVVENRTGAAGNIGAEAVAKAEPDGYTLLSAPPPPLVINQNLYPKLGFDPTEFVPIVIMGRVPNALVINAKLPFNSVAELIAYAKANPGKLTSATQGNGTTSHLTSETVPDDGGRQIPARALSRLGAGADRSRGRQRRSDVRQSRRVASAGEGRPAQALGRGHAQAHGVAAGRADDRGNAARLRIRRRGSRSWRRRRRRRRSSTRSTPTSTKRCARATSFSASRNSRPSRSAARPRRRPPICAKRSSAGTRSSRPPT